MKYQLIVLYTDISKFIKIFIFLVIKADQTLIEI